MTRLTVWLYWKDETLVIGFHFLLILCKYSYFLIFLSYLLFSISFGNQSLIFQEHPCLGVDKSAPLLVHFTSETSWFVLDFNVSYCPMCPSVYFTSNVMEICDPVITDHCLIVLLHWKNIRQFLLMVFSVSFTLWVMSKILLIICFF